jgi:asparagine synthase (glutamine-hydrolysing)
VLPTATIASLGKPDAAKVPQPEFPAWLDDDFASRTDARARWETMRAPTNSAHPVRPVGFGSFENASWSRLFESLDPGFTEAPVEFWHPYVDLRLLRYMLSVPPVPWCRRKYLLRQAMQNMLPDEVLRRDKAALAETPLFQSVRRTGMPQMVPTGELSKYVDPGKLPATMPGNATEFLLNLRPLVLNHWLWCSSVMNRNFQEEGSNGFGG